MTAMASAHRPDRRRAVIVGALLAVLVGGWAIANFDSLATSFKSLRERGHVESMAKREVEQRFQQGVLMLHAQQFDNAAVAFRRVLELAPRMPEAHANMGFALIGLQDWTMASIFFSTALEIDPRQNNAYYGLALALRGQGDLEGALGAMRTYVHLATSGDAYVPKAEAYIGTWVQERASASKRVGTEYPTDEQQQERRPDKRAKP